MPRMIFSTLSASLSPSNSSLWSYDSHMTHHNMISTIEGSIPFSLRVNDKFSKFFANSLEFLELSSVSDELENDGELHLLAVELLPLSERGHPSNECRLAVTTCTVNHIPQMLNLNKGRGSLYEGRGGGLIFD